MATYKNTGGRVANFTIGTVPGAPAEEFCVAPGGTCELGEGYSDYLRQYGLSLDTSSPKASEPEASESADPEASPKPARESPAPASEPTTELASSPEESTQIDGIEPRRRRGRGKK